jgi:hypothetical protein
LYHIPVIRLKPGETEASAAPSRKRMTMMPVKLCVAAWKLRMIPHIILDRKHRLVRIELEMKWSSHLWYKCEGGIITYKVHAKYLPMGKRTINIEAG